MKLVCPHCQSQFTLEAAMNDVAARQAVAKAFELTEVGSLLIGYVQLFKPAKQAISMVRLAKLLDEMVGMIKQGQITRNGNAYAAPQAYWQQAIEHMLQNRANLSLPLKSHGYLLEIIASYSTKAAAQAEAKAEQHKQQNSRYGAIKTAADHIGDANKMIEKPAKKQKSVAPINLGETLKNLNRKD